MTRTRCDTAGVHQEKAAGAIGILGQARSKAGLAGEGTLLIAEPMADTRGARASGDAYFGFYLLAMGSGRPRRPAEIEAMLEAAGFGDIASLRSRMPLVAGVITAKKVLSDKTN